MELFGLCSLYRPSMTQILILLFLINMIIFLPTGLHGDNPSGTTQVICILDMYDTPLSFQKCFRISSSQESFFSSTTASRWGTDQSKFGFKIGVAVKLFSRVKVYSLNFCEYVFIRSLPCLNSFTENVVD